MTDESDTRATPRPAATVTVEAGGRATVRLLGDGDRSAAGAVGDRLAELAVDGVRDLVVDLTLSARCGPDLLGVLADARTGVVGRGGAMRVVGLDPAGVLDDLDVAPLEQVFLVYDALRADSAPAPRRPSA